MVVYGGLGADGFALAVLARSGDQQALKVGDGQGCYPTLPTKLLKRGAQDL